MYPTVTVEHLASVATATDDSDNSDNSDDMKIYQFDREPSNDWIIYSCNCAPANVYRAQVEVLAA